MTIAWVLVAESSRAKIFTLESRRSPLHEAESFVHTSGRLHEGDLVSDRPGSDGARVGQGRHALSEATSAHEATVDQFARQLAARLDKACLTGQCRHVVLIAPPGFLGKLRAHLSKATLAAVVEEIDKNLVRHSADDIRKHISYAHAVAPAD